MILIDVEIRLVLMAHLACFSWKWSRSMTVVGYPWEGISDWWVLAHEMGVTRSSGLSIISMDIHDPRVRCNISVGYS